MKGNRIASICAYASLAISVVMMLLWGCNVGGFTVVSLDSFVGVIVALLAIVVTFAIAWQIYNAVELKQKVEELNILKSQFNNQKKELEQITYRFSHQIGYILGENYLKDRNGIEAFYYFIFSLENALQLETPMNVEVIMESMEECVDKIKEVIYCEPDLYDDVADSDNEIRTLGNYNFIKKRYENLIKKFMEKVKRDGEKE